MASIKLPDAKVFRGGITARQLNWETSHVDVQCSKPGAGVCNTFLVASKGGGTIEIQFQYGGQSYEAQLRAMLQNDRNAALIAMSKIVAEEMTALPTRDAEIKRSARVQIINAANSQQRKAQGTEEAIAMIVSDRVRTIVQSIEDAEQKPLNGQ